MKIYLASASPRRREIIEKIGIEAEILVSDVNEDVGISAPVELVERLARDKALSVADMVRERADKSDGHDAFPQDSFCVIGADTVVSIDGMILGKPADEADARRMLRLLSGRRHQVYTGVAVIIRGNSSCSIGQSEHDARSESGTMINGDAMVNSDVTVFHETTEVEFCEMTDSEIDSYIATGDPLDKAGAYGVQSYAAPYIRAIHGDYYNVMGLPASRLYHELKRLGCI